MKNHCCYIDNERNECEKDAEWFVIYGSAPDDYTHACTEHLGYLLGDEPYFQIWPIEMVQNEDKDGLL